MKAILWDFDGTLAYRPDMWSGALLDVLDEQEPAHQLTKADLRSGLLDGFPWHHPERPHHELSKPGAWWALVEGILADTFVGAGFEPARAQTLARAAHDRYADPDCFRLFEDTRPVLETLAGQHWKHVILSNHVPELPAIVSALGLDDLIAEVVTSARIGYDKPHPGAFEAGVKAVGNAEKIWMIGDNPEADYRGAEAVGISAILVRTDHQDTPRRAADLHGVLEWIR